MSIPPEQKTHRTSKALLPIFKTPRQHKFGVALNEEHNTHRDCWLDGPILEVSDPQKISSPFSLYLPDWVIDTKDTPSHKTLQFKHRTNGDLPTVRIKSKKIDIINEWIGAITKSVEDMKYLKMKMANHGIDLNVDGSFIHCRFLMTPSEFKFIDLQGALIHSVPRTKEIHAAPVFEDPKKFVMFKDNQPLYTMRAKSPEKLHRLVTTINSLPPEHQTVPQFVEANDDIPDIPDIPEDTAIGGIVEVAEENANGMLEAVLGGAIPLPEPSKPKPKNVEALTTSFGDYNAAMKKKLEKLNSIQRSEEAPTVDQLIADYVRHEEVPVNVDSILDDFPDLQDEGPLFSMKRNGATELFFSEEPRVPPADFDNNLASVVDFAECLQHTRSDIDLSRIGFTVPQAPANSFELINKALHDTPDSKRHLVAAAIFVQGRRGTIAELSQAIDTIPWVLQELKFVHRSFLFSDLKSCMAFFAELRRRSLIASFFAELETQHLFKRLNYHVDAALVIPGYCRQISAAFLNEQGFCPPPPPGFVPFDNADIYVKIAEIEGLYLRFNEAVQRFLQHQAELYLVPESVGDGKIKKKRRSVFSSTNEDKQTDLDGEEEMGEVPKKKEKKTQDSPLAEVISWLFKLLPKKFTEGGNFAKVWELIVAAKSKLPPEMHKPYEKTISIFPENDADPEVKTILLFLITLATDCTCYWIFSMIATSKPSNESNVQLILMEPSLKKFEVNDDTDSLENPRNIAIQLASQVKKILASNGSGLSLN